MAKVIVEFKSKVKGGLFHFPMIRKAHIKSGLEGCGAVMSYSNSELFESVINRYLKKSFGFPIGNTCLISDLHPDLGISVKDGFLSTFTFCFED